ncbi:MAG TPA: prepilin peptidase [Gemmatimonadales bacterium]|nr:prepilin peptidase [Gemmatimonadales bacterium]
MIAADSRTLQAAASMSLTGLMVVAAWSDLRTRRIPNQLTIAGLVAALLVRSLFGWPALSAGVQGAGLALAAGFVLYAIGAMGAGDAKLLGAMGAFMGPDNLIGALALIMIAGMIVAVVSVARKGLLPLLLVNTLDLFRSWKIFGGDGQGRRLTSPGALTVPYGVPIALGTLVWWFAGGVRI